MSKAKIQKIDQVTKVANQIKDAKSAALIQYQGLDAAGATVELK